MANTFRDGTVNIASIANPGVDVDIIPPTPFLTGSPTNIEGFVGVGSWGTPNSALTASSAGDAYGKVGRPQVRPFDIATCFAAALSQGTNISARLIRVTDGTDVAALVNLPSAFGRFTARSTGTLGNSIGVMFASSVGANSYSAIIQFPGVIAERFDNLFTGVLSIATVAGTGYTSVPSAQVTAPQKAITGVQAVVQPTLTTLTRAVAFGGTGYVVGDTITLAGGVVLTVATVTSGAVATVTAANAGALTSGAAPTTAVPQSSSSGAGTGATFTLTWGLGAPLFTNGGGYYTATGPALTITLTGGGGTGGTYTPTMSVSAALATAVNLGTYQRGRSGYVVFTPSTGTGVPTTGTVYPLTGGTDGANGVTSSILAGQDGNQTSRTGAYCLRGSNVDMFQLCDCNDAVVVPNMLALAIDETTAFTFSTASGDSIANAISSRQSNGFDDTNLHFVVGDMPTFNDGINGPRLVYPSSFILGLAGNLSPEQSPINKRLNGVLSTQTSSMGILTSNADNAVAQEGGVDFIGKTSALGADYFSWVTGRTSSSNTAARGLEYTRLTNFIARSLQGPATRSIVGLLQSTYRADDPTRKKAKSILDSFGGVLKDPAFGSGGYGVIEDWGTICDLSNNQPASIQRGFLFAYVAALYLNAVRTFVIKLNGGGNVTVASASTAATSVQAALAGLGQASNQVAA